MDFFWQQNKNILSGNFSQMYVLTIVYETKWIQYIIQSH